MKRLFNAEIFGVAITGIVVVIALTCGSPHVKAGPRPGTALTTQCRSLPAGPQRATGQFAVNLDGRLFCQIAAWQPEQGARCELTVLAGELDGQCYAADGTPAKGVSAKVDAADGRRHEWALSRAAGGVQVWYDGAQAFVLPYAPESH